MSSYSESAFRYQSVRSLCVAMGLLFLMTMNSSAQVTIKERVEIGTVGQIIGRGGRHSLLTTTDTFFVAPRTGVLFVVPFGAEKIDAPFPNEPYLEIRLSDTTYTPPLLPFLPCNMSIPNVYWFRCGEVITGATQYLYDQCGETPTCRTRRLQIGDTVRFAFQGEFYNPSSYFAWGDYSGEVEMETPTPPGCQLPNTPNEHLFVFLKLVDTVVTIFRPDSVNVYPTNPRPLRNNSTTRKNWISLEISVEYADSLIPNYWIRLDSVALVDSGGHSHNGTRPMGRYIVPKLTGLGVDTVTSGTRKTDSTGVLHFKFIASEFGGVERIHVHALSDTAKFDTLSLATRVRPLYDFATISSNFWVLSGNSGTTTYDSCPGTLIRHYSNHWIDSTYVDSVQSGILAFFKWSGSVEGGGQYLNLRANDMSLVDGGLFDICSNWRKGHASHRIGNDVDFNTSAVPFSGGNPVPLTNDQIDRLTEFMHDYGGNRVKEEKIHYRFLQR